MFKTLDTTILYVSDIKGSKDFYTKTLKFVIDFNDGNYVALKIHKDDKTKIALNADKILKDKVGKQTIILKTDNIESACKILREKNIPIISKLTTKSWGKTFTFTDPDGNRIEVMESINLVKVKQS